MVTASIVTHRTPLSDLEKVLACVDASSIDHLYIIDNSPADSLRDFFTGRKNVSYTHTANHGYGSGHNVAIRRAMEEGADYHLVLNADVHWSGDVIAELTAYMDRNGDVGLAMPKVYYPDGRLQYACGLCPAPLDLIAKRFLPESLTRRRLDRFLLRFTDHDRPMDVPYMMGSFMFFRVSALREVGLFDERFFMYPEDIDITRRMHARFRTMFYPGVSIVHAHAAASRKSLKMLRIHIVNMIKYFNKWGWFHDPERCTFNSRLLRETGYGREDN